MPPNQSNQNQGQGQTYVVQSNAQRIFCRSFSTAFFWRKSWNNKQFCYGLEAQKNLSYKKGISSESYWLKVSGCNWLDGVLRGLGETLSLGFRFCYRLFSRFCGGHPHLSLENDLDVSPLLGDGGERNLDNHKKDGLVSRLRYSQLFGVLFPPSIYDVVGHGYGFSLPYSLYYHTWKKH